ncbi:MAG TPA: hypothetical protein DCQ94_06755 [Nitrospira sp.]|uniref:Hypothetical conserved protein n=1 Tax=Candidatus Nitrosymbiomonas proteolyticus TaxID=2608984 RepID=A0A809SDN2_9BACT|nr:hypothetical conserved protein [Candidatus Nitrosymbiomonas proteolyticus]HAP39441.1 hypothetical protein [Nitrospira sp.]
MSASRKPSKCGPRKSGVRLTSRDRRVIGEIARYGAISRGQLMELGFFSSVSRANRRLRLLVEGKFLRRTFVATGPQQNSTIYVLGPAGVDVAVEDNSFDPIEMKRHGRRSPERMYLEHHLGVVSIRLVAIRESSDLRLLRYIAEPDCRHEYEVVVRGRVIKRLMKPDALAVFAHGDSMLSVYIEFDRGNTSLPQMAALFARYEAYWAETAYQSAYETDIPFTVALVTTAGRRRIDNLSRLTRRAAVSVTFTTFAQLESKGFGAAIWKSAKTEEFSTLWDPLPEGGGP